ncbi:MAG TPA: hypothetical protein ENK96_06650 [Desulfobulbaceae bacterium]|nr:hypothetical protein [Desulfobulbaceae bacterium]
MNVRNSQVSCKVFPSYEEYLENKIVPDFFIVESASDELGLLILRQLRGAVETFLHPVFLHGLSGEEYEFFSDGSVDTLQEALEKSEQLCLGRMQLQHDQEEYAESAMLRILAYLYLRPETIIQPLQQWNLPYLYSYPLVDVLAGNDAEPLHLIETLKNRSFIRSVDLVDRVRHCPSCNFSHFNFIDVCPSCGSIEIEKKPFLHCFTCGTVAPQERFLRGSALICPQCHAQLRHIGADYDRPLENYTCKGCGHFFQEPDIIAHCQNCGKKNKPDELVPWPVYSYQLTERGEYAVRTGELEDVYSLFDELQNINPVHFSYTVDWLLNLCRRHKEELFSLAGIRVANIPELHKRMGRYRLVELVDSYISRIRETIRTTDLTTRTVNDIIWILLPKTDCPNCDIVVSRILDLKSLTVQDEGIQLEFKTVAFSAPDNMIDGETGEQLLARLEGELT